MMMSSRENYPHGPKANWSKQALDIAAGKIRTDAADIPMLLEWLQDCNWPGTETIAEFLAAQEDQLVEPLRHVLRSRDHVWIAGVLMCFASRVSVRVWLSVVDELQSVACEYDEENAHIEAMRILAIHELVPGRVISNRLMNLRKKHRVDAEDYRQIEVLLNRSQQ